MKLTTLVLMITLTQVSAKTFAQKITLSELNTPLVDVFNHIREQTGYDFLFTGSALKEVKNVNIKVKNTDLYDALEQIFANQPLDFQIKGKSVIISPKQKSLLSHIREFLAIPVNVSGRVTDTTGAPILGATIKAGGKIVITNGNGAFFFSAKAGDKVTVSFIGYNTYEFTVTNNMAYQNIVLHSTSGKLNEVIVSTGYQTLPKERATGSFEVIDNKLFNRTVSPNLLSHIDGVVASVHLDNRTRSQSFSGSYITYPVSPEFSVRGLSTIRTFVANNATTSSQPLIVLDNFPYTGDINSINPNDVESVTILKDAAAASIWGARAGNGVVVINTKMGKYNQKPIISFNSSVTVGSKPDLFSQRQISTADYIGLERSLFAQGKYDAYYNPNPTSNLTLGKPVSDVVNLLFQVRAGTTTQAQADAQIAAFAGNDIRNDLTKYFFVHTLNQQYSLSVTGGSLQNRYYLSAGYDNNQAVNFSTEKRYSFSAGNTYRPVKNLEVSIPAYFTNNKTVTNGAYESNAASISPYSSLVNSAGNPQNVTFANGYSKTFIATVRAAGLYDLSYNPIKELQANQYPNATTNQFRITPDIKYTLPLGFSVEGKYQYSIANVNSSTLQSDSTLAVKRLISQYAQISSSGTITYPVNKGGIFSQSVTQQVENFFQATLNYNHDLGNDHRIDAIIGYEKSETTISGSNNGWYGYNPLSGTVQTILDNTTAFPNTLYKLSGYSFTSNSQIPVINQNIVGLFNAYRSYFGNGAYAFKKRYIASGSFRIDEANLFGVNTNLKRKALWSVGGSWIVNQENFYHLDWLPSLKFRATYGYQGNPPTSAVTSQATITFSSPTANSSQLPYATLTGLPNPDLTWEQVGQLNLGIDFGLKNNIISGTVEYYQKKSANLIAAYAIEPTTGATTRTGNIANLVNNGVDVTLQTQNIKTNSFKWSTSLLFSYNAEKVTKYLVTPNVINTLSGSATPIVGNAVYGIYSLKWGGLDAAGNPQGYDANGALSENYTSLVNNTALKDLVYNGRATPSVFGSFINTFSYKQLMLSANITYEAGFYFRAKSVNYTSLYGGNMLGALPNGADYDQRWQKPGDENSTYVPSAPTLANLSSYRDQFYTYSSVLVQKGDNIRLKDVTADYSFNNMRWIRRSPFSGLSLYCYYSPYLLIWKASKLNIDPDYQIIKPVQNISLGIRATLK